MKEIILNSGRTIKTDLIIIGTGVRPNVMLARECGLNIGSLGGIEVNKRMQTSDENIYACGDAVEVTNLITNKKALIPLAGSAQRQGRVAGANAAGGSLIYKGAVAAFVVRVLNLIAGKTGLSEREAKKEGFDYLVSYTHSPNHVGWFPEAKQMAVKVIFEKNTGRLLGAQVVGSDGVDKRIDVFATACSAGMTVYDLENLDLSYTPPFSSPKDPVNIASQVASNILRKDVEVMTPDELNGEYQILDVLKAPMFLRDSISGAKNIPISKLRDKIDELKNKKIAIYCRVGYTSYLAYRILKHHGFDVKNLSGGYETWKMFQKP
ncbi:MAG: FAD-dependent oxidoreductase [Nitrospinae bacterium]|nr:FAD-dependent oxidoreductase [Nitrospinota bacterium]